MNKIISLTICFITIFFSACKTKQKVIESKEALSSESVAETLVNNGCEDRKNNVIWLPADLSSLKIKPLESRFDLYELKGNGIQNIVERNFKKQTSYTLQMPLRVKGSVECTLFEVFNLSDMNTYEGNGGTIACALSGASGSPMDGQLTFNSQKGVRVTITVNEDTFLFLPIIANGQRYYLSVQEKFHTEVKNHLQVYGVRFID